MGELILGVEGWGKGEATEEALIGVDGEGEAATEEGVMGAGVPSVAVELRPLARASSSVT